MKFDLEEQIGEPGGFGKVYKCKNENEQELVCKILEGNTDTGLRIYIRKAQFIGI